MINWSFRGFGKKVIKHHRLLPAYVFDPVVAILRQNCKIYLVGVSVSVYWKSNKISSFKYELVVLSGYRNRYRCRSDEVSSSDWVPRAPGRINNIAWESRILNMYNLKTLLTRGNPLNILVFYYKNGTIKSPLRLY